MRGGSVPYVSTTNACKLCTPLGAGVAFRGIEGCVPFLHGSQGCATYMRRYIISHFREPVDIASSSLGEREAIYGGGPNLMQGLLNVMDKYQPGVIGVASTCLTETIGDNMPMILSQFKKEFPRPDMPQLIHVSTPSYAGTHMDGFHAAVKAALVHLVRECPDHSGVNLFPGFVSPADIRHLAGILDDFEIRGIILPDISETMDGPIKEDLEMIPSGGTPVRDIQSMGSSRASLEFGACIKDELSSALWLEKEHQVPAYRLDMPLGLRATDRFMDVLAEVSKRPVPRKHFLERGRLIDAYVDGHKYLFGKKCLVYGEEDLVVGLVSLLAEIGVRPVLAASGGRSGKLEQEVSRVCAGILPEPPRVLSGVDFYQIVEQARELKPDLVVGNSKGYRVASREWNIPLIRVGFPVHDRFGAARIRHLGYAGAHELLMRIVNAILDKKQTESEIGYGYM
ncbi:nitrogenase component 1 [Desulfonatronovibrio hydrogenovorans]|uniref:nitrogenase component 1 n=1 Tax=Desulfonatronovibrio hydrogenovorans TaxID=53245 RepID=UPI00048B152A|nr:nitrogenase component 1 [Desulfonatronovibrio hydrogenovorans]